MIISDFIKKDAELADKRKRFEAAIALNDKARESLNAALNQTNKTTLWKQLEGKALKGPKGDIWVFKKLKGEKGCEYFVEFIYSHPHEITAKMDRALSSALHWIAASGYELIEAPATCSIIENYIKERKEVRAKVNALYEQEMDCYRKAEELKTSLQEGKKEDLLRFLKAYKIVLDKGCYTFKSLRKEEQDKHRIWVVTYEFEGFGRSPFVASMELHRYLNIAALPEARLEPL